MGKELSKIDAPCKVMDGYDVVIIGGGPTGCVLAKDLTKAGKKVILIEKGGNNIEGIGTALGMLNGEHMEKAPFPNIWANTLEGHNVVLGTGMGGGSYLYAGIAAIPSFKYFEEVGINMKGYLEEAKKESWVSAPPDEFIGATTQALIDNCNAIGIPLERTIRHIHWDKCEYACTTAAYGCAHGAKWMGYYAGNEAFDAGATPLIYTEVKTLIVENDTCIGVRAVGVKDGQEYKIYGKFIVCSAGGIGSAMILRHSGIFHTGRSMFGDASTGCGALLPKNSTLQTHFYEHGTSCVWCDEENGALFFTNVTWPRWFWAMYQIMGHGIAGAIQTWRDFPRMISISNKCHDEGVGWITWDGKVSKSVTAHDQELMDYIRFTDEKIVKSVGCHPSTISHFGFSHVPGGLTFGHPGGTCKVGEIVDNKLETYKFKNCYVADISSLPAAPARPPVLTLVCMAKWFCNEVLLPRLDGTEKKAAKK